MVNLRGGLALRWAAKPARSFERCGATVSAANSGAEGMTPSLKPLVDLRNEVLHTGVASLTHAQQKIQYDAATDLIREYLLRLLGFKGNFDVSPTGGSVKTI